MLSVHDNITAESKGRTTRLTQTAMTVTSLSASHSAAYFQPVIIRGDQKIVSDPEHVLLISQTAPRHQHLNIPLNSCPFKNPSAPPRMKNGDVLATVLSRT